MISPDERDARQREDGDLMTRVTQRNRSVLTQHFLFNTVSSMFDVDTDLLAQPNRGPSKVAFARHVAMYLAHVACGLSLTAVGRLFKRDRTTVSYACRRIEDMRDRPQYDRAIGMMENTVRAIVRVSPALKQDLQLAEEENA